MARRKEAHGGGHGWFVTFADLMALLVSFFVMLVAFSTQDQAKLQVVAGSMREAFGVQDQVRYSGVVETPGLPTRPKLKNVARVNPEDASATPTPDEGGRLQDYGSKFDKDRAFSLASASLRQSLQELPDITEVSKNIMIEETKDGLNIQIVDQDGRAMFAQNAKEPLERTRRVLQAIAGPLRQMPYRISIIGHTAATRLPSPAGYGPWELSADRANAVRQVLAASGVPSGHFLQVAGKADTEPLFPDDAYLAANRRVTISLRREAPPMPPNAGP